MDKGRKKDFIVKMCCVVAAFALWLYISNVQNPIKTTVVRNVKVNIVNKEVLSQYNLVESPNQSYSVSITVKGVASEIYSLKSSQFKAVADINAYALKKGEMHVPVEIKQSPSNINIINPETLWVKLELDELKEKSVPVKVSVKGKHKEGFKVAEPLSTPNSVVINGPAQYVKDVSYASVEVDLNNEFKSVDQVLPIRLVNNAGARVEYVKAKPEYVKVQIVVDKTKYIQVETNIKENKNITIESVSISPENVRISGYADGLKRIGVIKTEEIDLGNIKSGDTIKVPLKIPNGIKLLDNDGKVKVKVIFNSITKKNISLNINVKNLNEQYEAIIDQQSVLLVVSGAKNILDALKNEDIDCYVDLNSLKEGNYNLPVNIKIPDSINKISYNPQTIKVNIKIKEVSDSNDN